MDFSFDSILKALGIGPNLSIGLDIGASAIKVVVLKNIKSKSPKIVGIALHEIPLGFLSGGALIDSKSLVPHIVAALQETRVNYLKQNVNLGMRGQGTIYKRLSIPDQDAEALNQQIFVEAQQHVDNDLTDWNVEHQILGPADSSGQIPVMLVAARKTIIDEFDALLKLVNVQSGVFDCDVFAIENAQEQSFGQTRELIVCIDVGHDTTKFNVIQDSLPVVARCINFGGANLTYSISRDFGCSLAEAESIKISASKSGDLDSDQQFHDLVQAHTDELNDELKRTLDFFSSSLAEGSKLTPDKIILSGGGACLKTLPDSIAKKFNTHVELANPFANIRVKGGLRGVSWVSPHVFAVAHGLALRHVGDSL